ncbi:MAG: thiamine phosphate synthase [Chloroflexota bacterium]|nr:thiamine phosphate synthase [Chloroflexota bacterium]
MTDELSLLETAKGALARLAKTVQQMLPTDPASRELADLLRELSREPASTGQPPSDPASALKTLALARAAVAALPEAPWVARVNLAADRIGAALGWQLRQGLRERMYGLYVIVDTEITGGRTPLEVAQAALRGGARMLQLRAKGADKGDVMPLARQLKQLCVSHKAVFIVNDHADLARAVEADGLHVGQHDLPVAAARHVLLPTQAIGRSNATPEEGRYSEAMGVDYVAVGAIYATGTKKSTRPAGLETLRRVKAAVHCPVIAIGGISKDNVAEVVKAGADAISVISAVSLTSDPEAAAREMVARIRQAGGRA